MPAQEGKTQPNPDGIERAKFTASGRPPVPVHFNPESLTLTFAAAMSERGTNEQSRGETGPAAAQQQANTFAATLSMKLIFDSTHTGQNVRQDTIEFQRMLRPTGRGGLVPQVVLFEWGAFRFSGTFASYTETIEYFSASGVPLRASVDISMTENQDLVDTASGSSDTSGRLGGFGNIEIGARAGISISAALGGDALGARAVAQLNGEESVRRLSGAALEVNADVELRGAVAFATGGVSLGLGGGLGIELGGGSGPGGSLGIEAPGSAGTTSDALGARGLGAGTVTAGLGGGVAAAPLDPAVGFGAVTAGGAAAAGAPAARAFARGVAGSAQAAAAAGVAGASSELLSPALAPSTGASSARGSAALGPAVPRPRASFASTRAGSAQPFFGDSDSAPAVLDGPLWGGQASAGVPAVFGAFAGLRPAPARVARARRRFDPERLLPTQAEAQRHTDADSIFEIGGRALSTQASGLTADVGANASLNQRIRFDEE